MRGTLEGKIALVTGAGRGIGRSVALDLARRGARVVVNFNKSVEGAQQVVAHIESQGGQATAIQADVSRSADVDRLFSRVEEGYHRLDILVNNAGQIVVTPLLELTEEQWDVMMNVNAKSVWLCSRAAVKLMAKEGGTIVNVSSEVARKAFPGGLAYSASKAALEMITRVLAVELGPLGIIVNAVAPGLTYTDMGRPFIENEDIYAAAIARTPAGRLSQPEDIAKVVAFLVSPDAFPLRGQVLVANGGGTL